MRHITNKLSYFTVDQLLKTRRRPSRLLLIPYNLGRHYLILAPYYKARYHLIIAPYYHLFLPVIWPRLFRFLAACLPIVISAANKLGVHTEALQKEFDQLEASLQFRKGQELLSENKPEESWRAFKECLGHTDNQRYFTTAAVCAYVGLGRMKQAIELFQVSNRIRRTQKHALDLDKFEKYCVLDDFWAMHIGHAAQIDYVIKLLLLKGRDPKNTILYVPRMDRVANPFLVKQWGEFLQLVTEPNKLPFPEKNIETLALDFYLPGTDGIGNYYLWELAAQTYRQWARDGRQPLLKIPRDVEDRGRQELAFLGMPPDAWFVGLHVREPHYQSHHRQLHGVLNANIEDYLPAIEEIVSHGGWVVRMGDPSMKPLPSLPKVIDYCHSNIRADWMDIFLASKSRFFVGTASGVCYVAQDYGVPCVLTNWWPPAQRPWHSCDIFVPKLLRRKRGGNVLSLEESLNEPFGYCNSESYMRESCGTIIERNSPGHIRAAVMEMLDFLEERPDYSPRDIALREQADHIYSSMAMRLYNSAGAFGSGVLARDFLRDYPAFVRV